MFRLGKPYGFPASYSILPVTKQKLINRLGENMEKHLKDVEHKWYFSEVLDELIYFKFVKDSSGIKDESGDLEDEEEEEIENVNT